MNAMNNDQRRVMCGDRVLADQWTGVVAAQHGPFSWVVIDGISVPQTHATIALRPVDNDHADRWSPRRLTMTTEQDRFEIGPHVLVVHLDRDGYLSVRVDCPHTTIDRPCGMWEEHAKDDPCRCECDACAIGDHDECDSPSIPDVGRQHCQCDPVNLCWFDHAVGEVGTEMLRLPKAGVTLRVPANMTGHGWDEPIDVEPIQ